VFFLRLFIVLSLFTASVFADEVELNAQQWLEKMSLSMKTLNYQGTVAFFKNGRLDTMKYFHTTDNGQEQERMLSLNSPMREVIREAGTVSCVFKDSQKIVVNHRPVSQSFIVDLPVEFSASSINYHFSLEDDESVAMLPTRVISIRAKDKYRYDRNIWIDKQSSLPLKMEVYDLSGGTLEQVVFTDLKVEKMLEFVNTTIKLENTKIEHIHQLESSSFDEADFVLENIPSGFKTVFFIRMKMDGSAQSVDHLLLSDGFSSISVYRETKADDIQQGLQTLGSVNSFSLVIDDFQITALGEVPAQTVQFIAQGVKLR
jgi:sigma-E factor negative regulatory protein RseB